MRLCGEIVDFVWLDTTDNIDKIACVCEITIVQEQSRLSGLGTSNLVVGTVEKMLQSAKPQNISEEI